MNDEAVIHVDPILVLLLLVALVIGVARRVVPPDRLARDQETAGVATSPTSYWVRSPKQRLSRSNFDLQSLEEWQRSVVSIGRYDPGCGTFSWLPHRTGFAVHSGETQGQLFATGDIRTLPHSADRFRVHAHPFSLPPGPYAQRAILAGTGGLSFVRTTSGDWIPPVKVVDWTMARYHQRFPIVLIGFHDGELIHFFTHSIGRSDSKGRIRLENRPPVGIGEFVGAAVLNKDGFVVGVFSPLSSKPTYVTSVTLRNYLNN